MKRGGGGKKGGEFERDVCKELSKAISGGLRKDLFWRTSMSGGRATLMRRAGQRNLSQMGDVSSLDSSSNWLTDRYMIECKHSKDTGLLPFLIHGGGKIANWVSTMEQQGHECQRRPLLVFRQNHMPILVLTRENGVTDGNSISIIDPTLTTRSGYYLFSFGQLLAALAALKGYTHGRTARRRPPPDVVSI